MILKNAEKAGENFSCYLLPKLCPYRFARIFFTDLPI